jgi:hypothetical protein
MQTQINGCNAAEVTVNDTYDVHIASGQSNIYGAREVAL